jgi:methyl-accepting chemotaxis protein
MSEIAEKYRRIFMSGVITVAAVVAASLGVLWYFASETENFSRSVQAKELANRVDVAVHGVVWEDYLNLVKELGAAVAQEKPVAAAASKKEGVAAALEAGARQGLVSAGTVGLSGFVLFDLKFNELGRYEPSGKLSLPEDLLNMAKPREKGDRLKIISDGYRNADGRPKIAVLSPVGGLFIKGYMLTVADVLHHMRQVKLASELDMALEVSDLDGKGELAKLIPEEAKGIEWTIIPSTLKGPKGNPLADLRAGVDNSEFDKGLKSLLLLVAGIAIVVSAIVATGGLLFLRRALNRTRDNEVRMRDEADEADRREKDAHERLEAERTEQALARAEAISKMVATIEAQTSHAVDAVKAGAGEMRDIVSQAQKQTDFLEEHAQMVAAAVEEAASNSNAVAAAVEELSASINTINSEVLEQARFTDEVSTIVKETEGSVTSLKEAAIAIGDVVSMISDIAEQTNLLALNATIEAARAGEAGKGFAVVAAEVKNLSTQTGKATESITEQVEAIQSVATQSVEAISKIAELVLKLDELSGGVKEGVSQQTEATGEISARVAETAKVANDIAGRVSSVSQGAQETQGLVSNMAENTNRLQSDVESLQSNIKKALETVESS